MKSGPCPKCGSKEIYLAPYRIKLTHGRHSMQLGIFDFAKIEEYICAECGFIESYLAGEEDMRKVIRKCEKVTVA